MKRTIGLAKALVSGIAIALCDVAVAATAVDVFGVEWEYAAIGGGNARIENLVSLPPELGGHVDVTYNLDGYTITGVNAAAFKGCKTLESVWFPSSVQSFGDGALCFRGMHIS